MYLVCHSITLPKWSQHSVYLLVSGSFFTLNVLHCIHTYIYMPLWSAEKKTFLILERNGWIYTVLCLAQRQGSKYWPVNRHCLVRVASWPARSSTHWSCWPVMQTLIPEQSAKSSHVNLRFCFLVKVQSCLWINNDTRISSLFSYFLTSQK